MPKGSVLPRGFKAESIRLADEVRDEIGLDAYERLDPLALAGHLGISVIKMRDIGASPWAVAHFTSVEDGAFSALTVCHGHARLIVVNDSHAPTRQASSVTHELAHGLLMHPPRVAIHHETGCRNYDPKLEAEADQLAGVLLVTDAAAMRIARNGGDLRAPAAVLGISVPLLRQRLNLSGATKRVQHAAARAARRGSQPS